MSTFWYVPLESLNARYTSQLSGKWIPAAFDAVPNDYQFVAVPTPVVSEEIKIGSVLDAVNRGVVSLAQMSWLLQQKMTSDDAVYLQDYWTPGLEALFYAWHLCGVKPRVYAMCHAQSVDEHDFTYPMRPWMHLLEIGWSRAMAGIFVASTLHRDLLRAAGVECPIHVVGLPIDSSEVSARMPHADKVRQVVFSSRLNNEKNPFFMLEVARAFLASHADWTWAVTTSAAAFTSEVPGLLSALHDAAHREPRLRLLQGLSKEHYYHELVRSDIQFNSSLQDWVSWTLLEATLAGCDICYPDFRSFPECVHPSRRYRPFEVESALDVLDECIRQPRTWSRPADVCNNGRLIEMAIMLKNWQGPEVNVWHMPGRYFRGVGLL